MAKQSLKIAQLKEDQRCAALGAILSQVGDQIGHYEAEKGQLDIDVIVEVKALLDRGMKEYGLTEEDTYKGTKKEPNPVWHMMVDAMNAPRIAAGLPELGTGTRDNYMSRIRQYLKDRGATPLDLHGSIAKEKAMQALRAAAEKSKDDAAPADKKTVSFKAKASEADDDAEEGSGEAANAPRYTLAALQDTLAGFITTNDEPDADAETELLLKMAEDFLQVVNNIVKKQKAKK